MRIFFTAILSFLSIQMYAQDQEVVDWIDENSIKIEDANPDTELTIFNQNIPQKFVDAKIFGFGEATHHGKEFFDIKAKFFKYLVETQDVKVFILEESYTAEAGINEWISGGKGSAETIANNFSIIPWRCKEVVNLLEWMRNYNSDKDQEKHIRFYGMDIQYVVGINKEIREIIKKYNIPASEKLLSVIDECAEKKVEYNKKNNWADTNLPKLNEIESTLINFKNDNQDIVVEEVDQAIRAINQLKHYTHYVQHSFSQERDLRMFENVNWIVDNYSKNAKAFIWAHNDHTNNQGFGNYNMGRNIYNLGRHLKEKYENEYYSVGFAFAKGDLGGWVFSDNQPPKWNNYQVTEAFPKTYSETMVEAKENIYFIDMSKALESNVSRFFDKKKKQFTLFAQGYVPNGKYNLTTKRFSKMFDGLIFIDSISLPNRSITAK